MCPPSPVDLYAAACAFYDREQPAQAVPLFEQVLAEQPGHIEARYKLANSYKELQRNDAAAAQYRALLARDPRHGEALNNVGALYQAQGLFDTAENCYRQAIAYRPGLAPPYVNLGRILQGQGQHEAAAQVYRRALEQGLDAGLFGHLLAALSGAGAPRAPQAYVRETFDAFAPGFEQRVVGELGYRVPELLAALVLPGLPPEAQGLDLGCGTGLAGAALRGRLAALTGVDLSARMLELAAAKGCYTALHEAELSNWLSGAPAAAFDLVLAADVFIYIGDLEDTFAGVARVLRPGGQFAFSIELCEGQDYRLQETGRYAQSPAYVAALAGRHGLALRHTQPWEVREGMPGRLFVLAC